jgi:hypothetical protein
MPNWCENDLTVEGKLERLQEFQEKMRGKDRYGEETHLNAEVLIPYPEEFRKLDEAAALYLKEHTDDWKNAPKDGFNSGGYEWCLENWGTKWGFCHVQEPELQSYGDSEGTLTYHFDTAWAPPEPLVKKMGELFSDLTFDLRYFEGLMQFNGILRIEHGQVTDERSGDYFGDRGG